MRMRRWLILLPAGLGVLAIIAPVAMWIYGSRLVQGERAACREAGMSMTADELLPDEPLADEENAALVYEQALALMGRKGDWPQQVREDWSSARSALRQDRWTTEETAAAERVVTHFRKVSDLLAQARMRPKCRFNQALRPLAILRPPALAVVALGQLEAFRARLAAAAGRRPEALEATESVLALAEALQDEPTVRLLIVRGVLVKQGRQSLAAILETGPLSGTERNRLLALLPEGAEVREHMQRAINADMILVGGEMFRELRKKANWLGNSLLNLDEAYYRRQMREIWLRAARPACRRLAGRDEPPPNYYLVSTMAAPGAVMVHLKKVDRWVVSADLTRIALWLDGHWQTGGEFPPTLGDLKRAPGQALPEDPFSGRSYGYRRTAQGYRLWSVGTDGRDQGGADEDDIVWELPTGEPAEQSPEATVIPPGTSPKGERDWQAYWAERVRRAREQARRKAGK